MSDYTPTTDEVFHAYWSHVAYERMLRGGEPPERAEFDRWLAEHDAEVRAEEREKYDRGEDQGPAANCHLCVGAGGYEDYDGEWRDCSCQLDTPSGTP